MKRRKKRKQKRRILGARRRRGKNSINDVKNVCGIRLTNRIMKKMTDENM